jgi:hypothetical protein
MVLTNGEYQTVYDVWKRADGLFHAENTEKWISFVSSSNERAGFVRVVGGEEGFTHKILKKFHVPAGHSCEVLGCEIMFTRT